MSTTFKSRTAQSVVTELETAGLTPTDNLLVAARQKWSLPELPIAELKAMLNVVVMPTLPSAEELLASGYADNLPACVAEHARLARNAKTNDWRQRTRLLAAIEARSLRTAVKQKPKAVKVAKDVAVEDLVTAGA